jgi:uncharacterized membrane protein
MKCNIDSEKMLFKLKKAFTILTLLYVLVHVCILMSFGYYFATRKKTYTFVVTLMLHFLPNANKFPNRINL